MSTPRENKLQIFLDRHKVGTVCLASWLDSLNISYDLQKRYRHSGWLKSIGTGALVRPDDIVHWQGGLYALQSQAKLPIHVGALSALAIQGLAHYLRMESETVYLFSVPKTTLPAWFRNYDWGIDIHYTSTSVLPKEIGLMEYEEKTFSLRIATPERAILECLHLTPDTMDLIECYQIMEGLTTLRPKLLQPLLEQCSSIKAKRLFLYMASKAEHDWIKRLDTSKLKLGTGDRTISKGGAYISEFGITVPKGLANL